MLFFSFFSFDVFFSISISPWILSIIISYTFFFLSVSGFLRGLISTINGFNLDLLSESIFCSIFDTFFFVFTFWVFFGVLSFSFNSFLIIIFWVISFLIILMTILGFFCLFTSFFFEVISLLTFSFLFLFLEEFSLFSLLLFSCLIIWISFNFFSFLSFLNFSIAFDSVFWLFPFFGECLFFECFFLEVSILLFSSLFSMKICVLWPLSCPFILLTWLCKITENILSLSFISIFSFYKKNGNYL